jgi:UDP-glucose 6-dehydrogenase
VLGVSFKPTSPVTIGSPSKVLIQDLLKSGKKVYTYDKLGETHDNLQIKTNVCETAQQCIDNSDVVVIMHPDRDFSVLKYGDKKVIDLWGIVK